MQPALHSLRRFPQCANFRQMGLGVTHMILTCPNCLTRYQADAAKIPATGRKVRCAKCAHVWHQVPAVEPEPELAVVAERPPIVARSEPSPTTMAPPSSPPRIIQRAEPLPVARAQPAPQEAAIAPHVEAPPVARFQPAPQVAALAPRDEAPPVARVPPAPQLGAFAPRDEPVHVDARDEPHQGSVLARLAMATGWTALALVVLLVGWATVSFRGDIIRAWPQSASLYRAIGLSLSATGLQLVGVKDRVETEGGAHVLIVSGMLVNNSNHVLPVPSLRIALTDLAQHEIYHWPVPPNVSTLEPGQAATFQARLAHPPGRMHDVEITFARADE